VVGSVTAPVRIGSSSWTSEAWWGRFYPNGLKDGDRLAYYARYYDTVEIDSTYYRDPGPGLFARWARVTPGSFLFAVKFPRDLIDPKEPVDRAAIEGFIDHAQQLGAKLGPVLLQFPPWMKPGRATDFLAQVLDALPKGPRYAVELRAKEWFAGDVGADLLRSLEARHITFTWSYLTYVDVPPALTSDVVYLRFIGDHTTVPESTHGRISVDRQKEMHLWADRLRAARERIAQAFVFFNNHFQGYAPGSIRLFRNELDGPGAELPGPPEGLGPAFG
jgi:uncharacterized protein YecE (DUF72 family)